MASNSGKTISIWMATAEVPARSSLAEDTHADVCLVGAGIAGMTTAAIATNTPINDIVTIHAKQAPYTTYVVGARIPRGSVTRALYWDTLDPYHYVRLQSAPDGRGGHDLLIVGGEDHKSGQADDGAERYARLEAWARERFPMIERVEFHWSGQVMEPVDGVAFIGRNPGDPRNVYLATGDSGMGMTHGTIAGILITDLLTGRECAWAPLYDPSRKTLRSHHRARGPQAQPVSSELGLRVVSTDEVRQELSGYSRFRRRARRLFRRDGIARRRNLAPTFDARRA